MRWLTCFVVVCSGLSQLQAQEDNQPPNGYRALFNGKDLSGWRGMGHFDPYKLAAMSDEDRDAFFLKNKADMETHWTVQDGALVNDGKGVYLTTEDSFENFVFGVE
ncbi:MAG: family 16 glycoside hydrolase [Planctomycetota bacterium]|nr:family 16 glycoside hydrolase [Planctomycetota bacterium]